MTQLQQLLFTRHIAQHNVDISNVDEFAMRFNLWTEKDMIINIHNMDPAASYTLGHNKFSTWTQDEYESILGFRP